MRATIAASIGGLLVGILAGREPVAEPVPAAPAVAEEADQAGACERQQRALEARLDFLTRRGNELLYDNIVEEYQVSRAAGEPLSWPAEPPERLARDRLTETVRDTARKRSAEVLTIDCEEYPCLAVIRQAQGADSPFAREVVGSYRRFDILEHRVEVGEHAYEAVLFYPKTWAGREEKLARLRFRAETRVDWYARSAPSVAP